jgi:hypothetical protein
MAGTAKRIAGPAYIAASATNVYTPAASTILTIIRHIHIANVTALAATFSLYVGGTGGSSGGTEIDKTKSVGANDVYDWFGYLPMTSADFLVAICETGASKLTITVSGDQVVV